MATKRNAAYIGLGILAAFGIWKYFRKGNAATRLRFIADGISLSKGIIYFTLKIINGANAGIKIDSIIGDLIYKGNTIGVVSYQTPTEILANSEKRIKFKITPDLSGAGMAIFSLLTSSKEERKKVNFTFKGTVNAEGVLFDFEENYNF